MKLFNETSLSKECRRVITRKRKSRREGTNLEKIESSRRSEKMRGEREMRQSKKEKWKEWSEANGEMRRRRSDNREKSLRIGEPKRGEDEED